MTDEPRRDPDADPAIDQALDQAIDQALDPALDRADREPLAAVLAEIREDLVPASVSPSPDLAGFFAGASLPIMGSADDVDPEAVSLEDRRRSRHVAAVLAAGVGVKVALGATAAAAVLGGAGIAGVLPAPVQEVVDRLIHPGSVVEPLEAPPEREKGKKGKKAGRDRGDGNSAATGAETRNGQAGGAGKKSDGGGSRPAKAEGPGSGGGGGNAPGQQGDGPAQAGGHSQGAGNGAGSGPKSGGGRGDEGRPRSQGNQGSGTATGGGGQAGQGGPRTGGSGAKGDGQDDGDDAQERGKPAQGDAVDVANEN